jgi:hypothetical protein
MGPRICFLLFGFGFAGGAGLGRGLELGGHFFGGGADDSEAGALSRAPLFGGFPLVATEEIEEEVRCTEELAHGK